MKFIVIEILFNSVIGHQVFEDEEDAIRYATERGMDVCPAFSKSQIEKVLREDKRFAQDTEWEVCYRKL